MEGGRGRPCLSISNKQNAGCENRCRGRAAACSPGLLLPGSRTWLEQRVVAHHRFPPHFAVHRSLGVPNDPVPAAQLHAVQRGVAGGARQAAAQRLLLLLWKQRKAHAASRLEEQGGRCCLSGDCLSGEVFRSGGAMAESRGVPPATACIIACMWHKGIHAAHEDHCYAMPAHAGHAVLPHPSSQVPQLLPHLYVKKY